MNDVYAILADKVWFTKIL